MAAARPGRHGLLQGRQLGPGPPAPPGSVGLAGLLDEPDAGRPAASHAAVVEGDIWGRMCRLAATASATTTAGSPANTGSRHAEYRSARVAGQVGDFYECLRQWVCEDGDDEDVPAASVRYGQAGHAVPPGHPAYSAVSATPPPLLPGLAGSAYEGRGEQWELFCYLGRTADGRTKLRIPLQAIQMNGEGQRGARDRRAGKDGKFYGFLWKVFHI